MSRAWKLVILAVVAAAQLAVPAWMIGQREWVLRNGKEFKFRAAPIDPYDAFRGRYVWLSLRETKAAYAGDIPLTSGRDVYVKLEVGDDGFARFAEALLQPPATGEYLRMKVSYQDFQAPKSVNLANPFDRYYMPEAKAPEAETAYRSHARGREADAYVTVRIHNGYSVLENLYVGGMAVEEYITKNTGTQP